MSERKKVILEQLTKGQLLEHCMDVQEQLDKEKRKNVDAMFKKAEAKMSQPNGRLENKAANAMEALLTYLNQIDVNHDVMGSTTNITMSVCLVPPAVDSRAQDLLDMLQVRANSTAMRTF